MGINCSHISEEGTWSFQNGTVLNGETVDLQCSTCHIAMEGVVNVWATASSLTSNYIVISAASASLGDDGSHAMLKFKSNDFAAHTAGNLHINASLDMYDPSCKGYVLWEPPGWASQVLLMCTTRDNHTAQSRSTTVRRVRHHNIFFATIRGGLELL